MIDGKEYCKTSGHLSIHLKKHNMTHEEYYLKYSGQKKSICQCGDVCTFDVKLYSYKRTCKSRKCIGVLISEGREFRSDEDRLEYSKKMSMSRKAFFATPRGQRTMNEIAKKNSIKAEAAREKRIQTMIATYGKEWYNSEKASLTKKNRPKAETEDIYKRALQTKREKYGGDIFSVAGRKSFLYLNSGPSMIKRRETCLKRYGTPTYIPKQSGRESKLSKRLYSILSERFENVEREIRITKNLKTYFIDFKIGDLYIEVFGDYWHANPIKYSPEDVINYPNGVVKKAEGVWKKDVDRISALNIDVLIIWEKDIRNDIDDIVRRIEDHVQKKS